jgi:hypothetical protein
LMRTASRSRRPRRFCGIALRDEQQAARCELECSLCLKGAARLRVVRLRAALPRFVRLSSELARQAVRQDCSFAKKQESPPALLVVVPSGRAPDGDADARSSRACGSLVTSPLRTLPRRGGIRAVGWPRGPDAVRDRAEAPAMPHGSRSLRAGECEGE